MSAVDARDVTVSYGAKHVLDGFSLQVPEGQVFGLLGASGCGKSSFLNACMSMERVRRGSLEVLGKKPAKGRPDVGFCTQYDSFLSDLTVRENLDYFGQLMGLGSNSVDQTLSVLMPLVGFSGMDSQLASSLSGGQARRLDFLLSVLAQPALLLVDEPTVGLDPSSRKNIWDLLVALKKSGTTIMLTTHYMFEAEALCDAVAIVHQGKVAAAGTVDELKDRFIPDDFVRLKCRPASAAVLYPLANALKKRGLADSVVVEPTGLLVSSSRPKEVMAFVYAELKQTEEQIESMDVKEPSFNDVFFLATGQGVREMGETS